MDGFASKKEVERIIKSYNALGIPVRFTWTNVLLEEQHTYDTYCNMIMKVGNNGMNQVLVNRPVLEEYIRKNYPDYKVLSSTTKRILNVDHLIEELEKDYFLVVLDYDFNHDEKVLEKIQPYADRIEILVNETCQGHCPSRVKHYIEMSRHQLEFDTSIQFPCSDPAKERNTFNASMRSPNFISNDDIVEYSKRGFVNFKIVGRGLTREFYIDSIIYYLVKPENRDFMRKYITGMVARLSGGQPRR